MKLKKFLKEISNNERIVIKKITYNEETEIICSEREKSKITLGFLSEYKDHRVAWFTTSWVQEASKVLLTIYVHPKKV